MDAISGPLLVQAVQQAEAVNPQAAEGGNLAAARVALDSLARSFLLGYLANFLPGGSDSSSADTALQLSIDSLGNDLDAGSPVGQLQQDVGNVVTSLGQTDGASFGSAAAQQEITGALNTFGGGAVGPGIGDYASALNNLVQGVTSGVIGTAIGPNAEAAWDAGLAANAQAWHDILANPSQVNADTSESFLDAAEIAVSSLIGDGGVGDINTLRGDISTLQTDRGKDALTVYSDGVKALKDAATVIGLIKPFAKTAQQAAKDLGLVQDITDKLRKLLSLHVGA